MTKNLIRSFDLPLQRLIEVLGKIKDCPVRSKLCSVERSVGCRGCGGSRCQVCENIKVTHTFASFTTNTHIRLISFDGNDKCLFAHVNVFIYLFTGHVVNNYTGTAAEQFKTRWNNYKSEAGKAA